MIMNNTNWFVLANPTDLYAIYLKNPTSSKYIDIIVIEKNNTNILIGLTEVLLNILSFKSSKGMILKDNINIAPSNATTIYVLI